MRDDVLKAIEKFEIKTFGNQKNIEKGEALLKADEKVLFVQPTNIVITTSALKKEMLPGVVFLTDKRMLFHYKLLLNSSTDAISLDEIRSINSKGNSMTGGHIEIHTITKTYDILVSYKQEMIQKIRSEFETAKENFSSVLETATQQPDLLEQIEKLSGLKEKGIITEDEFQSKKTELLSKL